MVSGSSPGPAPAAHAAAEQLPADPVELAHVAPAEAAQERAQGRGRLDREPQHPSGVTRPQRVGVVDVVAARERRHHQRQQLVADVGASGPRAQVEVLVHQLLRDPGGGPAWRAGSGPRRAPGGRHRRPCRGGRGCGMIASIGCSFGRGDGLFATPSSQHGWAPDSSFQQPQRVSAPHPSVDPGLVMFLGADETPQAAARRSSRRSATPRGRGRARTRGR